jgi:hypothetical protein
LLLQDDYQQGGLLEKRPKSKTIRWFGQLTNKDVGLVGGKNALLGEMIGNLKAEGIEITRVNLQPIACRQIKRNGAGITSIRKPRMWKR